ncbi:Methionine aminopeptidase 1D, mitochondrial [Orchesella cincta]|uniref:Methionine aminopeptidase n=1 Tax=Orchesella cincta TaxID=48709 RepID=A0A1D2MFB1_ORCCI|nr:Methionine aminopeptidase 1D, mitochondrial [Orchesella cincta]
MFKVTTLSCILQRSIKRMTFPAVGVSEGPNRYYFLQRIGCYNSRHFVTTPLMSSKGSDIEGSVDNDEDGYRSLYGAYELVVPQKVSALLKVPSHIQLPNYVPTPDGRPLGPAKKGPFIRTKEELDIMRDTCILTKQILRKTIREVKVGVTTDELDKYAHHLIIENNAYPSSLLYKKFPKSICTSVNNVACHGIPDSRKLLDGDIITIDLMVYKNGFHGDCAETALVGNVDEKGKCLVKTAKQCLDLGINQCGPNVPFEYIGKCIEDYANDLNYSVVGAFAGHGIGRNVHELPEIYHYERPDVKKQLMIPGMTFTVEPVISQGMDLVTLLSDGWTYVTVDGSRAAQFEDMILITNQGFEVLTL